MSVAYHKVRNYSCAPGIAIDGSTSALGQTEKNSVRAYVFRFALELGHRSMLRRNPFRPFLADFIEAPEFASENGGTSKGQSRRVFYTTREAAGASRARHSLRPLISDGQGSQVKPRAYQRRDRGSVFAAMWLYEIQIRSTSQARPVRVIENYRGARLARMRCRVRRCMFSRRAVSETLRLHIS